VARLYAELVDARAERDRLRHVLIRLHNDALGGAIRSLQHAQHLDRAARDAAVAYLQGRS
jgi:hypothetical protein